MADSVGHWDTARRRPRDCCGPLHKTYARAPPPAARIDLASERNTLTRPSSPKLDVKIGTESSRPCLLLDVLPLEVRQLIWVEVLGGHHFDIRFFVYIFCHYPQLQNERILSLALCCKQTYLEAVRYLYSANTFSTSDAAVMEHLPSLLLRQRINAISSFTFLWHFPLSPGEVLVQESLAIDTTHPHYSGHPGVWNTTWKNISSMKGLQTLNVKLNIFSPDCQSLNKETATQLLLPIRDVVRPKSFILCLPFPAMDGLPPVIIHPWSAVDGWEGIDPWDDLPCTIRRVSSWTEL